MVEEYVAVYQFFGLVGLWELVQELEEMVYFRQLIVGHSKVQVTGEKNMDENVPLAYFNRLFVKAGSKERAYFSV